MQFPDNTLLLRARDALAARLPPGWQVTLQKAETSAGRWISDAYLNIHGPTGPTGRLVVEAKRNLHPRGVLQLRAMISKGSEEGPVVVVAPYLSPAVRELLQEADLGYLDLTGNAHVALARPALFVQTAGASRDPNRTPRPSRSLRGDKAGRVVRALIDHRDPPGVRRIAEMTGVSAGYVARLVAFLDREALIDRRGHGRIVSVHWRRLLERWAAEAPLRSRGRELTCLAPRGLPALTSALVHSKVRYAVTGTLAVADLAPVAETRLAVVYVTDPDDAVSKLDLRVAERGANVLLVEPTDAAVLDGRSLQNGLRAVGVSQAAADLLTSPGRGPAEAEALIGWMQEHEEQWRG